MVFFSLKRSKLDNICKVNNSICDKKSSESCRIIFLYLGNSAYYSMVIINGRRGISPLLSTDFYNNYKALVKPGKIKI